MAVPMSLPSVPSQSTSAAIIFAVLLGLAPAAGVFLLHTTAFPAQEDGLSIILMIGDGMGYEHVKLGRLVEVGEDSDLVMEQSPLNISVTTHSANANITDSAAAGTAIATGIKTNNGMISVNPSGETLDTILEIAQTLGKSTGLVSTCYIQHATPATFMTHVASRSNLSVISRQIVEEANVDILLGGGKAYFSEAQLDEMEANSYAIVENSTQLASVSSGKVLGLFSAGHMPYEQDRNYSIVPSLAAMTIKSLEILSQDSDGFFLMVEGGRIDHAGHANDKIDAALDTIAFDEAVEVALDYVQGHSNTILIITADHECGGLLVLSDTLNDDLPSHWNTEEQNRMLRIARANNVTATWSTDYHTADDVPLYYYGIESDFLTNNSVIDNIEIFDLMQSYYLGQSSTTTTTTIATTTTTTTISDNTTPISSGPGSLGSSNIDILLLILIPVMVSIIILIVLRFEKQS